MNRRRDTQQAQPCDRFVLSLVCGAAMVILIASGGCSGGGSEVPRIAISMRVLKANAEHCLVAVTLVNNSRQEIVMMEHDLPWHIHSESLTIALVNEDSSRTPISPTPTFSDPFIGLPIRLSPGAEISGQVKLDVYYRGLCPALLQNDVTLLWVYRPYVNNLELEPIVGHVLIPRIQSQQGQGSASGQTNFYPRPRAPDLRLLWLDQHQAREKLESPIRTTPAI